MKIVDSIGNEVIRGRLLLWKERGIFVRVEDVSKPTEGQDGVLTVSMKIGLKAGKGDGMQLTDYVTVFDPEEQSRTDVTVDRGLHLARAAR